MTRIVLIDDHKLLLDSLQLLLNTIPDTEIIGKISDSRELIDFLKTHPADLVISDLHMPHFSGIDLTLKLKGDFPELKVLLLTMAEDAIHIREAIKAGVHGYILKKSGKEEIEKAISTIMQGKRYYSEAVIDELADNFGEDYNNARPDTIEKLTSRELEILKLITLEKTTSEIAEMLFISIPTVETHRSNLMKKLSVKSSIGMVKYAIKRGLVS